MNIDTTGSTNIVSFPKLVELKLQDCSELKEWEDIIAEEEDRITTMPNLQELTILDCDQLEALPTRLIRKASRLEKLDCSSDNELLVESIRKDNELSGRQLNCFSSVKQIPWPRDIASRTKDINETMNKVFSEMEDSELASNKVSLTIMMIDETKLRLLMS
ncbi:hypothetical protein Leryth_015299 [Lithospermum erythrorhizon]|nr:hypothetical protein Leryth_015299 [Lithospermum erythrorhizon]